MHHSIRSKKKERESVAVIAFFSCARKHTHRHTQRSVLQVSLTPVAATKRSFMAPDDAEDTDMDELVIRIRAR